MSVSIATFAHLDIAYDEQVLEPRGWVALQSRWAAELLAGAPPGPILELCCGAGHIGLLAADLSGRGLLAVDLDPVACRFAADNAESAGLGDRVEIRPGELSRVLRPGERFALVVADPPWVTSAAVATFPDDPVLAIDGGDDGLDVARAVLRASAGRVPVGGSLLVQLGDADQAAAVCDDGARLGWSAGALRIGERGVVQQVLWDGH